MTIAPTRPRGRRPGHDDTRGTIARAASQLFDKHGYDAVSMRAIARQAEVDPALVHHYFVCKARLFAQVALGVEWDVEQRVDDVVDGPQSTIGVRAARAFFALRPEAVGGGLRPVGGVVEAGGVLEAGGGGEAEGPTRRCFSEFVARELFARVAARVGHRNAVLRGQLAVSALLGLMVCRQVLTMPALAGASVRSLTEPLGAVLQYYLVEEW